MEFWWCFDVLLADQLYLHIFLVQFSWEAGKMIFHRKSPNVSMEQGQLLGHSLLLHPNHLHPLVRASAAAVAAARAVTAGAICFVATAI
jgi:hypothetical protein